jgi:hypothetical protein
MSRRTLADEIESIEQQIRDLALHNESEITSIAQRLSEVSAREREERTHCEVTPPRHEPPQPHIQYIPLRPRVRGPVSAFLNATPAQQATTAPHEREPQVNDRVRIKLYNGAYVDGIIVGRTAKRVQVKLPGRGGVTLRSPHNVQVLP